MKTTKKAKIAFLKEKLATDDAWALRGLKTVFQQQTEHEKAVAKTEEDNGVGFSGLDAEFLTSLAVQHRNRGWLSLNQMVYLRRKMPKYAGQLLRFSDHAKLEKAMGQPPLVAATAPPVKTLDTVMDWQNKRSVSQRQSAYYDHSTYEVAILDGFTESDVREALHAAYQPQMNKFGGFTTVGEVTVTGQTATIELIYHIGD